MESNRNIRLTSAEISQLWSAYMNDRMSVQVLTYFLNKVEDADIRAVIEYGLKRSETAHSYNKKHV